TTGSRSSSARPRRRSPPPSLKMSCSTRRSQADRLSARLQSVTSLRLTEPPTDERLIGALAVLTDGELAFDYPDQLEKLFAGLASWVLSGQNCSSNLPGSDRIPARVSERRQAARADHCDHK